MVLGYSFAIYFSIITWFVLLARLSVSTNMESFTNCAIQVKLEYTIHSNTVIMVAMEGMVHHRCLWCAHLPW